MPLLPETAYFAPLRRVEHARCVTALLDDSRHHVSIPLPARVARMVKVWQAAQKPGADLVLRASTPRCLRATTNAAWLLGMPSAAKPCSAGESLCQTSSPSCAIPTGIFLPLVGSTICRQEQSRQHHAQQQLKQCTTGPCKATDYVQIIQRGREYIIKWQKNVFERGPRRGQHAGRLHGALAPRVPLFDLFKPTDVVNSCVFS